MSQALNWEIIFLPIRFFSSLSPCWFFIRGGECRKLPRYVPYKCTYVPYNGTFGASDQGQMLDVLGWHPADGNAELVVTPDVTTSSWKIPWTSQDISIRISADLLDHTGWIQGWIQFNGCSVRCGARLGGSKSNAVNLILRLFLYHFLHTMSSWHHESIHNNTNNRQTPPPWWWSRSPLQQRGFDESTSSEWRAALHIHFSRPLLKGLV